MTDSKKPINTFEDLELWQFCRQARGSLFEIIDHLITSYDENYIDEDKYRELKELSYRCIKVLNGYIASLRKRKATQ